MLTKMCHFLTSLCGFLATRAKKAKKRPRFWGRIKGEVGVKYGELGSFEPINKFLFGQCVKKNLH